MERLKRLLHQENCSLVLRDQEGSIHLYFKQGVRDLQYITDHSPSLLHGASIADKVIGKAAAGYMALGGVSQVYADVISRKALPILQEATIKISYNEMVDTIVLTEGDTRCRLEEIVSTVHSPQAIVDVLKAHFQEMKTKNK